MDFTKQLATSYKRKGIQIQTIQKSVTYVKPIIELDKKKEDVLLAGDGQSNPEEYKQINSILFPGIVRRPLHLRTG